MKRGELAVKLERWEPLAPCAACFLLTAVLCGAQLFGGYAPFALGLVAAAGSGKRGLAALLGGVAGALVFLDFSHALRTLAVAVLLYTANNAFCETRWYRSRRFLPAMTALMYLAVELVYLLQAGADRAALCLLSIALAVLAAVCARAVLEGKTMNEEQRQAALLVVVTGVLMAASALRLENGFAPGRILAMLLVMLLAYDRSAGTALAAALGIGALFLLPESLQARFLSMLDFSNASASGRFVLWSECLAVWKDHWPLGIGLGPENFSTAYVPYATGLLDFQPPHSNMLYLEMFLSTGIVGGLLFCGFFFGIFVRLRRAVRARPEKRDRWETQALIAALAGAALGGIPEYIWFYPRILFFWCALFGMALAVSGDN